jgi:hypothetical protein
MLQTHQEPTTTAISRSLTQPHTRYNNTAHATPCQSAYLAEAAICRPHYAASWGVLPQLLSQELAVSGAPSSQAASAFPTSHSACAHSSSTPQQEASILADVEKGRCCGVDLASPTWMQVCMDVMMMVMQAAQTEQPHTHAVHRLEAAVARTACCSCTSLISTCVAFCPPANPLC